MLLPHEPLSGAALVASVFSPEDVPDARLYRRLKTTTERMLRSVLSEGDDRAHNAKRAEQRGAARLYANARVEPDLLAQRAQQHCLEAVRSLPKLLVAHDSIEFDKHGRHEPRDAGPLRSSEARGYLVHHGVIIDPRSETRAGLIYLRAWTRPYPKGKRRPEGKVPVRREWDNEDDKWGWGVEQTHKALRREGFDVPVRHLADAEGSSYASLSKAKRRRRDYVTPTKTDRRIREGRGYLFEHLHTQPVVARWTMTVGNKPSSTARGTPRPRRQAEVELRFAPVTLLPTCNYKGRAYRHGLPLWAVDVYEPDPPPGSEPITWRLLCTQPVTTEAEAEEVVLDYRCRWGAEDVAKVLKSACHAELETVPDLAAFQRLLAVAWPVAMHLLRWTYASRVDPLALAVPHLGDDAIEALKLACRYHRLPLPRRPWTLKDVISRLAQLGGYEPRKNQPPGWKVIWRGWRVFHNIWGAARFVQANPDLPRVAAPPGGDVPVLRRARSRKKAA